MALKQQATSKEKNIRLLVEEDENVGFYLYVYDLKTGECIKDLLYFHDQLEDLYYKALNEYGIKKQSFFNIT